MRHWKKLFKQKSREQEATRREKRIAFDIKAKCCDGVMKGKEGSTTEGSIEKKKSNRATSE